MPTSHYFISSSFQLNKTDKKFLTKNIKWDGPHFLRSHTHMHAHKPKT